LGIKEPTQNHSERTMTIVGIGFYGIIGPFFFEQNVNGNAY
jgi:hypothetical protein